MMYAVEFSNGLWRTNRVPVVRFAWITDGHPVCEKLYVRMHVGGQVDLGTLLNRLEFVPFRVDMYTDDPAVHWVIQDAYMTELGYPTLNDGSIYLDVQFLYMLNQKRFSLSALRNETAPPKRGRERQPVDWWRFGF